jgi:hypothetical protein
LFWRGLTRAIYILCIVHLRILRLSEKSNPGPPALQASTLWKEPFERPYLVAIRDLTCAATVFCKMLSYMLKQIKSPFEMTSIYQSWAMCNVKIPNTFTNYRFASLGK